MKEIFCDFIAPEANILVVDDNRVNQKLVLGLLEPLRVQIQTANNGLEAFEMVKQQHFDMILMDHMMPVMDGIEATRQIRNLEEAYYKNLPIIALSGNVDCEGSAKFMEAGMNGVLAKPLDISKLYETLRKWLPKDMVYRVEEQPAHKRDESPSHGQKIPECLGDLNLRAAIVNCGSEELLLEVFGDVYKLIDSKAHKIEECLHDEMYRDYTIEVHSLRNTARLIGADELEKLAGVLEEAGDANASTQDSIALIHKLTPILLDKYRSYKTLLKPFAWEDDAHKPLMPKEKMGFCINRMIHAANNFNLDVIDKVMKTLREYHMPEVLEEDIEKLDEYVIDVDMENILRKSKEIFNKLDNVW